jgi:membrane protein CcdC involved in cytochrome C biogenesis
MIDQVEMKRRRIRWWFNIVSSVIVMLFGLMLLVLRYLMGKNPFGERYWVITGLLLGYGLVRLVLHMWRGQHLYDDMEDNE